MIALRLNSHQYCLNLIRSKAKLMSSKIEIIKELLNDFCNEILNSPSYAKICHRVLHELEQHPDHPLARGKENIWAAGIAHAVGSINFLFQSSSSPHISVNDLNYFFGTRATTTGKKSLDLRDLLHISAYSSDYQISQTSSDDPLDQIKEAIVKKFGVPEEDVEAILSSINRPDCPVIHKTDYSAIRIIPKEKFWDWVETQIDLDQIDPNMRQDYNVYLVYDIELKSSIEEELHLKYKEIWKIEATRYINPESDFPTGSFLEFLQWFEVRISSHVMDLTGELLDDFNEEDLDDEFESDDNNFPPDFSLN